MSEKIQFRPDEAYATRCWINAVMVYGIAAGIWTIPGGIALALSKSAAGGVALLVVPNVLFVIIAALYIPAWVANVRYEMTDEEVVVYKGVFSKVHKIVPFRTVTNVSTTRGWLDRIWLGIGNVNIQTAGAGATSIAEERLVGLRNFEEIRDAVVEHLRRYRADTRPALGGGLSGAAQPAAPGEEPVGGDIAQQMLQELRAIRELLERRA
ncbi:MAG: PH domain-containing protein [Armatimonadota bacterium]